MSYVRGSTENPLGWRPWNSRLSFYSPGSFVLPTTGTVTPRARLGALARRRARLGQDATQTAAIAEQGGGPSETDVQSQASGILAQLQQANQQLNQLEALIRSDPNVAAAIGADEIKARQQYTDAASKYTQYYTLLFGSAPSGLTGLGQLTTVTLVAIAVGLAGIAAVAAYLISQYIPVLQTRAAAAQQQAATSAQATSMISSLQSQYQAAIAAGDYTTAAQLNQQIQAAAQASGTSTPTSFSEWIQGNWGWVALAVGGIVVLNRVL